MIYLYGLIETDTSSKNHIPLELTGVTGPVQATSFDEGLLVWSTHDGSEILPKRRNLLAHTRVIEALMETGSVLPMRFGMLVRDLDEVSQLMKAKADQITTQFDRIRGNVELSVRVTYPRQVAIDATLDGSASLKAARDKLRGARHGAHFARADFGRELADILDRRRGEAQKKMIAALLPHCLSHVLRAPEEDIETLRAEFLVRQENQQAFTQALEDTAQASGFAPGAEATIRLLGPVPMYHFVELSLSSPEHEEVA